MQYGFVLPFGDARTIAEHARLAEESGWDAFFIAEAVVGTDAWVALAAAAMLTSRIRLGTLLTPVSRRRPWKLASETVTLDQLSGGRVILSVGLGALDTGFEAFGEVTDRKARAELLDEGLEIITRLWQGERFSYTGKHYTVKPEFWAPPRPVQQPRIPIWVVGAWPRPKSIARALRYDGIIPAGQDEQGQHRFLRPDEIRAVRAHADEQRPGLPPLDIVIEGNTPIGEPTAAAEQVRHWAAAGASWWIESPWDLPAPSEAAKQELIRERMRQGPPR
jgi:alkanesulfonate monooxygenase SsuD/methylene tetrahydromethanopterin reductase-like flavin-dependent oxidoreductase (luciferase family)